MTFRTPPQSVILIAGPTASGKSGLALAVAEALQPRGEALIINADAMQVYRDLAILTARPGAEALGRVPHALYGHVDAARAYSVGAWLREAAPLIEAAAAAGRRVLLVGGTGLYFAALTEGLAEIPDIDPDARAAAAAIPLADLPARARAADPQAAAGVAPGDVQRLRRILEVREQTGRPLSAWRANTRPTLARERWIGFALTPDRDALYARIDARAAAMLERGALEEVEALLARGLDPSLPAMKALGVDILGAVIAGRSTREEALARLQRDTRRYAKRQRTWIRGRMAAWTALASPDEQAVLARLEGL